MATYPKGDEKTVGITIGGVGLFGAERRILKLYSKLCGSDSPSRFLLMVTPEFFVAAQKSDFALDVFDQARKRGNFIILPSKRSIDWKSVYRLMRFLFATRAAVYMGLGTRRYARLFSKFRRSIAYEITSPDIAESLARESSSKFLTSVDLFVCVSPSVENKFLRNFRERFPDGREARTASYTIAYCDIRETTAQPKEKLVVSASRFLRRKNVHKLAEALAIAGPRMPKWSFALLGEGEMQAEIDAAVAPLASEDRVEVGYTSDVSQYLARSSIYVSLIEPDNYPSQSVLEAMAHRNALLLSNVGDSARFLSFDGENGRLTSLDVGEIAENLVALASDEEALETMGRSSRYHVEAVFDAKNYIREFEAFVSMLD